MCVTRETGRKTGQVGKRGVGGEKKEGKRQGIIRERAKIFLQRMKIPVKPWEPDGDEYRYWRKICGHMFSIF